MIGRVVDACTKATSSADPAIVAMSQDAPTDWMSPPKFDARLASHTARKTPCWNGASGDVLALKEESSGTATSEDDGTRMDRKLVRDRFQRQPLKRGRQVTDAPGVGSLAREPAARRPAACLSLAGFV